MAFAWNTWYEIKNVQYGNLVNLYGNHSGATISDGNKISLFSSTGDRDQKWQGVPYYNGAKIVSQRNDNYVFNKHSGDSSAIAWRCPTATVADSEIDFITHDASQNLYRIKLKRHNLFLTATGASSTLYWRAPTNTNAQLFKLIPTTGSVLNSLLYPLQRYNSITQHYSSGHLGVDYAVENGVPIYAARAGQVIFKRTYNQQNTAATGWDTMGNCVYVQHTNFGMTLYMHMNAPCTLAVGANVARGATLGYVGKTGRATGNHLHFGLKTGSTFRYNNVDAYYDGTWANPASYL